MGKNHRVSHALKTVIAMPMKHSAWRSITARGHYDIYGLARN